MGNFIAKECYFNDTTSEKKGSLRLFIGPMYSGKTSKLIEMYNNSSNAIVITHKCDTRYSEHKLINHDKREIDCLRYKTISQFLKENIDLINNSDLILIDEGQFFQDLFICMDLVEKYNKDVCIFGLDGDYNRNEFGYILKMIPYCDSVEKLTGRCTRCNNDSIFSKRIINNNKKQILVGNMYEPLCRKCYLQ
tara:strand:+ start:312 stop:890 length:579 start_codon:yes stop_codon:yes gene_type:complete